MSKRNMNWGHPEADETKHDQKINEEEIEKMKREKQRPKRDEEKTKSK